MRKFNSKSKKIGTLRIDGTLWEKLKERAISRKWGFPLICSCNPKKKVWPDFKYGFHREDEREYLDFKDFPFLEGVVDKVMEVKPECGRFHINEDFVILADNNLKVCKIKIV